MRGTRRRTTDERSRDLKRFPILGIQIGEVSRPAPARTAGGAGPERRRRVAALRAAIRAGTYRIDARSLAERMLDQIGQG